MNIDSTFGPIVAFGIGGIFVEAIQDVTFRLCPTTKERALRMIDEIKMQKMLNGFRGLPPVDRDALADMIVRVSELAMELDEYIKEIDLNPVIARCRCKNYLEIIITKESSSLFFPLFCSRS